MPLIRAVDILELGQRRRSLERRGYLGGELTLPVYQCAYLALALLKAAQLCQAVVQTAKNGIIERARYLLAVTRDKGDGIAVVDERNGLFDLRLSYTELGRQR